ncbi:hypothetical protein R1sor_013553 [Riccia sorocarpa]|uniref:Uncharacterized protein n=1 Tax=Riccia sorocarpa TaxID=122646 RepID=A0ABD3HD28_9MARC
MPREEYRYVDGDPARYSNLAGYINSVVGTRRPTREPNVMWVLIEDPPASYGRRDLEFHVSAFEVYPRRLGEAIETGGMLRYESDPDPPIVEEDVISSEDEEVGGLQDEEDAMADLFTEWFLPEPPTGNTLVLINFV